MPIKSKAHRLTRLMTDIMAGSASPTKKLDRLLWLFSSAFSVDVASIYIVHPRQKDELLLYASKGLHTEIIEKSTLKVGEGFIGEVVRLKKTLTLEAPHTYSSLLTDLSLQENRSSTLLGIPLLYGGKTVGVLSLQTQEPRIFPEEEIDILEMAAMVISEIVVHKITPTFSQKKLRSVPFKEEPHSFDIKDHPSRLVGIPLAPGIAVGKALFYSPTLYLHPALTENKALEHKRLKEASSALDKNLELLSAKCDSLLHKMPSHTPHSSEDNPHDILESYRMFSKDSGWLSRLHEAIESGLTAEAALQKVYNDMRQNMLSAHDPLFIELLYDFEDLTHRLIRVLNGDKSLSKPQRYKEDIILFAKSLGPAELLEHYSSHLKGIVLEEGSATAHITILARSLGIPLLGWTPNLFESVKEGETIVLDATSGILLINPALSIQKAYAQEIALLTQELHNEEISLHLPYAESSSEEGTIISKDGVKVELFLNAGLSLDIIHMHSLKARGVGLFRTEIPFMLQGEYPNVSTQIKIYKKVLQDAQRKPVIFRTLDIGGDKLLPYFDLPKDQNPLMGWRAIRIGLDRPSIFRQQIRALLRASHDQDLYLMFPMIGDTNEIETAKKYVELEIDREKELKKPLPSSLKIGITLEIPSLVWNLETVVQMVDFISVGSNDLFQFFHACDRGNPLVSERYDILNTPFLRLLDFIQTTISSYNVPLSLCGEMASNPIGALVLLGLGYTKLSLNSPSYLSIKNMIPHVEVKKVQSYIKSLLLESSSSIREKIVAYALKNSYPILQN